MKLKAFTRLACIAICSCFTLATSTAQNSAEYLAIKGTHFVDQEGRTVILNGINHVNKNPEQKYLDANDKELFKQFKAWGFNFVRYGIHWDGLEPEPGVINEAYLREIDKRVAWAKEAGIWLMLDMHQDLYGRKFGNGAPDWATLDEGLPHQTGAVWSEAYIISEAVKKSFDNFWANKPASDGVGIQDHYINVWKVVAERYKDSPSVAGFDVMNEPFMGSPVNEVFPKLLEGYALGLYQAEGKTVDPAQLMAMFSNDEARNKLLATLNNSARYDALLIPATPIVDKFEVEVLTPFYQKTRDAIRSVNKKQIIFLEHNYFCNLGIASRFKTPTDASGNVDRLCAYAPHGYDLTVDTDEAKNPGDKRVAYIFDQLFKMGKEKNMPTIVGEWGAFYSEKVNYSEPAQHIVSMMEANLAGQSYWTYWGHINKQDYFYVLARPYPMRTNGVLKTYKNDFAKRTFTCTWDENSASKSATLIYIPNIKTFNLAGVKVTPATACKIIPIKDGTSGYLKIKPKGGVRDLVFQY